ncbi:MAG: prefoldin subunit alpha [Nitrosopumilus sp.]|nr:prefoldin subunit alpha [Nitrosopumilus sp.]MDH3489183.1 prefoldin subunit alpha [Nitrosopumilus sp.]MDH3516182.1 prefoldin subunit alpha [Nitrosopumilus sp.]MDH3565457.1 prefoldin subunit alpha [Nitrosopumilus sp.]MDH5416946.1 prefoldin subunit alpha [Nitrosopumilus sp.]
MSEEQAEQLMQQMQMLETYFSDLSQREASFVNIFRETVAAIESIKSLSQKPESETLVPIGMGAYLPTKISSNSKIILNIGAGVAVEKDFPSAINFLEARVKEIEIAINDTSAKKQDAAGRLEQGRIQINQLMQSISPPNSG